MPALPTTDLELAQQACTLARIKKIGAFADNTTEAIALNENYEVIVVNELQEYSFKFSKKQWDAVNNATAPLARWETAWDIPADCVWVDTVTQNGEPIEYEQYLGRIFCNAEATDTITIDGVQRPAVSAWPANFIQLVKYRLAELLADGVAQKPTMAKRFADKATELQLKMRSRNSQSVTNKKFTVNRLKNSRRGAASRR